MTNLKLFRFGRILVTMVVTFTILLVLQVCSCADDSGKCGDHVTYYFDSDTGVLEIAGRGKMDNPNSHMSVPWHDYQGDIKSVIIKDGVTSIGKWAFNNCTGIEGISIPDSVTSIRNYAFTNCTSLISIEIPDGVSSIGAYAFSNASALKEITIPNSVTSIGSYAFNGCSSLIDIKIPENVTSIGSDAFNSCTSLTHIDIPNSVTSIGIRGFYECTSLVTVNMSSSVSIIDSHLFSGCDKLQKITVPCYVNRIEYFAFYGCDDLTICTTAGSFAESYATNNSISCQIVNDNKSYSWHTFTGESEVIVPTCESEGYTTHFCTRCDGHIDSFLEKLGHEYNNDVVEPTCTSEGYTHYVCIRCEYNYTADYVDIVDHVPNGEPTCVGDQFCVKCLKVLRERIGHNYALEWTIDVPALPGKPGVKTRHCLSCESTIDAKDSLVDTSTLYSDVVDASWYEGAVNYAVTYGLMNGVASERFAPYETTTRAMVVTILYRMIGSPNVNAVTPFSDLEDEWYKSAVAWAYENDIVNGVGETSFAPNDAITREQLATILYRYAIYNNCGTDSTAYTSIFPDAHKVSIWARNAFIWANVEGLITGNNIGGVAYLDPLGKATRAQVAVILMRYCENINK